MRDRIAIKQERIRRLQSGEVELEEDREETSSRTKEGACSRVDLSER